jgi:hypothetical protein
MSYNITNITCNTYIIADIHPHDKKGLVGNKYYVGCMLMGVLKTSYSFSVDLVQAKEGALMALEGSIDRYGNAVVNSFALGSFERYHTLENSLYPNMGTSICIVELSAFQDYIANVTGDLGTRAREILEAYHHHLLMIHILFHQF